MYGTAALLRSNMLGRKPGPGGAKYTTGVPGETTCWEYARLSSATGSCQTRGHHVELRRQTTNRLPRPQGREGGGQGEMARDTLSPSRQEDERNQVPRFVRSVVRMVRELL